MTSQDSNNIDFWHVGYVWQLSAHRQWPGEQNTAQVWKNLKI